MASSPPFIRVPDRLKKLIRHYKAWRLGPRAANDHATHIPVLAALGLVMDVRSVLEFGSGFFSTLTLLDRTLFPNLTSIHSYENDAEWYEKVKERTSHDDRLVLTCVDGPLNRLAGQLNLAEYDLIFVDDARSAKLRAETIRTVVTYHSPRNVIVIHDFEVEAYQHAAEGVQRKYRMNAFNPNTGILWDGDKLQTRQLHSANQLIRNNASRWDPADAKKWHEILLQLTK